MKSIEVQAGLLQKTLAKKVNRNNSRHSEKTENLASSVDFRLIQNLSMLIKFMMSGWVPRPTVTTAVYTAKFISIAVGIEIPTYYSLLTTHLRYKLSVLATSISSSFVIDGFFNLTFKTSSKIS